jgi:hypothetical protein
VESVRKEDREATKVPTVPWWVGPAFAVLAVGTIPWVVFLAVTLPRHATFVHYRAVWVGFDTALIGVLATTAVLAWRGRPQVSMAATAAATMLLVDAWFDVLTTPRGRGLVLSLVLAGGAEVPLALICLWIALHASQVIEGRTAMLARRATRAEKRASAASVAAAPAAPAEAGGVDGVQ